MSDSRIIQNVPQREDQATDAFFNTVYKELRQLAHQKLRHERSDLTLQTTDLVHEAFLRLVGPDRNCSWQNRGHFFASAAEAMRRILIELARRRKTRKHGEGRNRVPIDFANPSAVSQSERLLDINDAIERLESSAPDKAQLVKLRFFVGMTIAEAAEVLEISHATAERYWAFARAWLYCELNREADEKT